MMHIGGGGGGNRLKYFLCKCNPDSGGLLFAFEIIQFPSSLGNHKLTQIAKVVIKICEHEVCVTFVFTELCTASCVSKRVKTGKRSPPMVQEPTSWI